MIVYEFWLKEQFRTQVFETLCETFYNMGKIMGRWDDPRDGETGEPMEASCVYAVSKNHDTHWVQLLVDDNTPVPIITAIEARINGLKDGYPIRKYTSTKNNAAPMESTR